MTKDFHKAVISEKEFYNVAISIVTECFSTHVDAYLYARTKRDTY